MLDGPSSLHQRGGAGKGKGKKDALLFLGEIKRNKVYIAIFARRWGWEKKEKEKKDGVNRMLRSGSWDHGVGEKREEKGRKKTIEKKRVKDGTILALSHPVPL